MRLTLLCLLALGAFLIVSCGMLSQEQAQTVAAVLSDLRVKGTITEEQYQALLQALHDGGTWEDLLAELATIGVAVAGSLFGVRVWRGGIEHRKGSIPEASAPTTVVVQ